MSMFCKNCGTQIGENARFCPKCGQPVNTMPTGAQPGNIRPTAGQPEQVQAMTGFTYEVPIIRDDSKKKKSHLALILIPIILLVVLAGGFFAVKQIRFVPVETKEQLYSDGEYFGTNKQENTFYKSGNIKTATNEREFMSQGGNKSYTVTTYDEIGNTLSIINISDEGDKTTQTYEYEYQYNEEKQIIAATATTDSGATQRCEYTYYPSGKLESSVIYNEYGEKQVETQYTEFGKIEKYAILDVGYEMSHTFDKHGNIMSTSYVSGEGAEPVTKTYELKLDFWGNAVKSTSSDGSITETTYKPLFMVGE